MEAALITGMFNVGFSNTREPVKDVFTKKDSDFKDVLSKKMENDKKEDVNKKDDKIEDVDKVDEKNEDVKETDCEDKDVKKEEKVKEKDKDKKIVDDSEDKTEKINGLIEKRLEIVEKIEDFTSIKDELKKGLVESIDEVGPQSVETETIKLDKFEKLEAKLDKLAEKLGLSSEDNKEISEDGAEMSENSEEDSDSAFMSSVNEDVLTEKDVKREVKSKDEKFSITDLRKNNTLENNVEQLEMDVEKIDNEIPQFDITNTNNIIMGRAEKLQEQIDVLKQITEKVTVNLLEDKSEMLIKLKPDNLGKVTMQIAVENGNISAKFLAESEKVKEILESNMQELKDHLAKQGMAVQDLSVSVGNEDRNREIFNQGSFKTFRKTRSIERIENNSYFSSADLYEDENVNLAALWPDSTVSFSA